MNSLSDLNLTRPGVGRPSLLAIVTLLILNNEFHAKSLLQISVILDFLLNSNFHFYSHAVRLSPNKLSIYDFYFVESFHVFETDSS